MPAPFPVVEHLGTQCDSFSAKEVAMANRTSGFHRIARHSMSIGGDHIEHQILEHTARRMRLRDQWFG